MFIWLWIKRLFNSIVLKSSLKTLELHNIDMTYTENKNNPRFIFITGAMLTKRHTVALLNRVFLVQRVVDTLCTDGSSCTIALDSLKQSQLACLFLTELISTINKPF